MTYTLGKLIDNGLLREVGQITSNEIVCYSWNIENDLIFKNDADSQGTEVDFLVLYFDNNGTLRFRLDSEVTFDELDLHVVEDYSKSEYTLSFQKLIDIDPENF